MKQLNLKKNKWIRLWMAAAALLFGTIGLAQPIVGTPLQLGTGVTKTMQEIMAYSAEAERQAGGPGQPIQLRQEQHLPLELPAPGEESRRFSRSYPTTNEAARPTNTAGTTQEIWSNFMGSDFTSALGGWPPDNNGDVSPSQLLLIQNYRVKVYPKPQVFNAPVTTPNGTSTTLLASPVLDISLNNFFRTAFSGVDLTDPHVRYDRLTGRWFIIAMTTNESTNNFLVLAVSSANTIAPPTVNTVGTSFTFFRTSISAFPGDAGRFMDYPTLGLDKFSLYVGANFFTNSTGSYAQTSCYVINKADMIAGTLTITPFSAVGTSASGVGTDMRTPQGAQNDDPAATEGFFISTSAFFSQLIIRRVTYAGTTPTLQPPVVIPVATNRSPLKQVALGSSGTLDASNTRLFAAMIMKDKVSNTSSLWTAQNISVQADGTSSTTAANNNRNGSRWYEIRNFASATPTVHQFGTLFNSAAANPRGFWFPTIAMSGQGHAVMVSTSSSAIDRIDINLAGRYRTTPNGDLEDSIYATATTSDYNPINGGSFVDRWGDYSQVVVDPVDNMTMWAFQQYTNAPNSYGVRAVQLKAPAPPAFTVTNSNGTFCGTAVNVSLNGSSVNNREFFDPGADPGGPGYSRLRVEVSGGTPTTTIPVSNVNFVSPTQVTFTMNTQGVTAPAGTYSVMVVNPDGQISTGSFQLTNPCTGGVSTTLTLTGQLVNEQAQLNWITPTENNTKEFMVEKSIDGIRFTAIGTEPAKGTSGVRSDYAFLDKFPYPGASFYRIKLVFRDGSSIFSNVVRLVTPQKALVVTRLFPNPAKEKVSLEIVSDQQRTASIRLLGFSGKLVYMRSLVLTPGLNEVDVPLGNLAAAAYYIEVLDEQGKVFFKRKFIKN
jgi:hypothetical protein